MQLITRATTTEEDNAITAQLEVSNALPGKPHTAASLVQQAIDSYLASLLVLRAARDTVRLGELSADKAARVRAILNE